MGYRFASRVLVAILAASVSATAGVSSAEPVPSGTAIPAPPSCREPGTQPPKAANSHAATAEDYPPLSVALSEQGRVIVSMLVRDDGSVSDVKVLQTSGFPRLDEAAVTELVPHWKYTPAIRDGKPIMCRWEASVVWSLQGNSPDELPPNFPMTVMQMGPEYYTDDMRARHEQGWAVIFGLLSEDGKISFANVVKSSGYPDIDAASLKFMQSGWQFKPAEAGGRPIKSVVAIAFVWSLTPKPAAQGAIPPVGVPPKPLTAPAPATPK